MQTTRLAVGIGLAVVLALVGCQNPLQVGLGDKVDLDVPDIALSSHPAGEYLSGVVTLSGPYSDDFAIQPGGITLSFDGGETREQAAIDAASLTWSYEVNTADYPDGEIEVLLTITDGSGKDIEKRILYYFDNTAPLVMVKNPQGYETNLYNGLITVRGESADVFGIDEVNVRILDSAGDPLSSFELADGTNSWVYEFDSRVVLTSTAGQVGLEVQATDRAGNQSTQLVHYDDILFNNGGAAITIEDVLRILNGTPVEGTTLTADEIEANYLSSVPIQIDNDLDKPSVTIVSPNNGQNIGGSILVTGTAYDDDGVARVEMRLDLNGDGDFNDSFNIDGTPGTDGMFEVESDWETLAGTVLWTQDLNLDGELYQVEPGHDGQVGIEVRAVDINSPEVVGNSVKITVRFDDTIPRIESLNYITGDYVSGLFTLTGTIEDDERVDRVRISYDGGISYTDIFNRSEGTDDGISDGAPYPLGTSGDPLHLSMPVDTSNIPGHGEILSGPLYLRLLVIDNAGYQALTYLTLNVDNFPAGAAWDTGSADPLDIRGNEALVQGDARDIGTVSGFAAVHVYFVSKTNGHFYDPSTPDTHIAPGGGDSAVFYNGTSWWPLPDEIPTSPTLPTTASYPYPADSAYRIQIDNENEFGNDTPKPPGDDDGYDETITIAVPDAVWSATFDSFNLPDGEYSIHYVVFDEAGNGTHYVIDGFVKNYVPEFASLVLSTDVNGDGDTTDTDLNGDGALTTDDTEYATYTSPSSPLATGFTGRNDLLYVEINAEPGGNTPLAYSLQKDGAGPNLISAGNSVEIDTSNAVDYPDGTISFTATITDAVNISETLDFTVIIDNVDDSAPVVTLDTLTQAHVKETAGDPEGHLELATQSGDGDADLSGVIILSGTVTDDQIIDAITLDIDGYDPDGAGPLGPGDTHTVAQWDGSTLVEQVATGVFTITDASLSEDGGHAVSWTYEWNTADIDTVAATDVVVTIGASD